MKHPVLLMLAIYVISALLSVGVLVFIIKLVIGILKSSGVI